jgi:hypothetical protein
MSLMRTANNSKSICLSLIVLLLGIPLLTACSDGTTGSRSGFTSAYGSTSYAGFGGITQLKMIDADNGWATTGKAVLKTSDGGQHWTDVTPSDWESTAQQSDPNDPNNKGISAAFFLDEQDAWIVGSNANSQEGQIAATAIANSTPDVHTQMQVYVRATIDGGKTWMDAQQIQVDNLSLIYPPSFINQHEGWLALSTTDSDGSNRAVHIYHSTDGGITWQQSSTVSGVSDNDSVAGLTMAANCTTSCSVSNLSKVQGCTTTATTDTSGWLVHGNKGSLLLQQTVDSGLMWRYAGWQTPGGAPGQSDDSLIVASPPIAFTDGTGILPIQIQSDPDGNDPSNFYLHLYKMSFENGVGAYETDLSTTSPFASQSVAAYHTLSAPDINHIFVLGYELNNGTASSRTNLYEWSGSNWQTLSSQVSSSSSSSGSSLFTDGDLTNLDFISDTEGWATSDTALYHITLNGNNATWAQVFPPAGATGNVTLTRSPGQVLSAPADPGDCDSSNNSKLVQSSPPPVLGERTITVVNNTSQTIWAAAAGNAGFATPDNGGWVMTPGSTFTVKVANNWQGRFWGRTYCPLDNPGNGKCETGDCGRGLYCNGATAASPQTLAEFTFDGANGDDYYDVSDVDGFNIPVTITPVGGAAPDPNNKYRCGVAGCGVDMNADCPAALQQKDSSGRIVGCNSACAVFGTDQYCCEGTYVGAACNPKTWPVDYAAYFKGKCSTSYSYAYDDATSTFTDTNANYRITFGPAS